MTPRRPSAHASLPALLCALLVFITVHCANALRSTTDHQQRAPEGLTPKTTGDTHGSGSDWEVLPYVTDDAVVGGAVSVKAQAALEAALDSWAGGRRALLHGNRRPRKYSTCPLCTMISCTSDSGAGYDTRCSGHCKTRRNLFVCRGPGTGTGGCDDPDPRDPQTVPVDGFEHQRSAEVEVDSPFMGCANVKGLLSGCPPNGNTGTRADGTEYTVLWTVCQEHWYQSKCYLGENRSLFLPFGYCMCVVQIELPDGGVKVQQHPCSLAELHGYSGPPLEDTDDETVHVIASGSKTITKFGNRDDVDYLWYTYTHTFTFRDTSVPTVLRLYGPRQEMSDYMEVEAPL